MSARRQSAAHSRMSGVGADVLFLGRKEITTFFYIFLMLTITSLILDSGVIPAGNSAYPYFVAVQNGFASALCTSLLINGFVGFQLYEDGTTQSVWLLRGFSVAMFFVSFAVSILTFMGQVGLSPTNTVGLFVVLYVVNGVCLLVYVIMQIILVVNTLQDRWPLGDIVFGVFFFVAGQVILYVFGDTICAGADHYLDGLFITTICNLLAVMMVYKVWVPSVFLSPDALALCFAYVLNLLHVSLTSDFGSCSPSDSTGILLPRKTLNSALVQSRGTGRSKSPYPRTIVAQRCIRMSIRSILAACTSGTPGTVAAINDHTRSSGTSNTTTTRHVHLLRLGLATSAFSTASGFFQGHRTVLGGRAVFTRVRDIPVWIFDASIARAPHDYRAQMTPRIMYHRIGVSIA